MIKLQNLLIQWHHRNHCISPVFVPTYNLHFYSLQLPRKAPLQKLITHMQYLKLTHMYLRVVENSYFNLLISNIHIDTSTLISKSTSHIHLSSSNLNYCHLNKKSTKQTQVLMLIARACQHFTTAINVGDWRFFALLLLQAQLRNVQMLSPTTILGTCLKCRSSFISYAPDNGGLDI